MTDLELRKKSFNDKFSNRENFANSHNPNEDIEKLKLLFKNCDSNKNGKLNRNELISLCYQLNMHEFLEDILAVVGCDSITFDEFIHCRSRILEINNGKSPEYLVHSPYYSQPSAEQPPNGSCSDISAVYSCADCCGDSGNKNDGQSHHEQHKEENLPLSLHLMIQQCQPDLYERFCVLDRGNNSVGQQILQIANQIHLSRINRLYCELKNSVKRITSSNASRDMCQKEISRLQSERDEIKSELENQSSRYEDRITELHGVIAELHKKLDLRNKQVILEEVEEGEDDEDDEREEEREKVVEENVEKPGGLGRGTRGTVTGALTNNAIHAGSTTEEGTEDYEKLDLRKTNHLWSSVENCTNNDYRMISIQKDEIPVTATDLGANLKSQVDSDKQLRGLQQNQLYLQEKLTSYEIVVCNLRLQLSSILDEKENLRRQLREFQASYDVNMPQQQQPQQQQLPYNNNNNNIIYPPVSTSQSKISLDSKSTNSSSSSPARPIMGVRQQQCKQNQLKSQTSNSNEPDWVLKIANKYHHHYQIHSHTCNSSTNEYLSNNGSINMSNPSVYGSSDNSITSQPAIFTSGYLFLQQLVDTIPFPSLVDPLQRILLQWNKFIASYDRESADNILLQATLAESKAVSDQLQCCVAQLQSEVAASNRSNQLADQQIEIMDILIQLQDTSLPIIGSSSSGVGNSNNNNNNNNNIFYNNEIVCMDNSIYQNSSLASMTKSTFNDHHNNSTSSYNQSNSRVRQSYRDQVETAAKLILCRLESSPVNNNSNNNNNNSNNNKTNSNKSLNNIVHSHSGRHGRQTPDSGCVGNVTSSSTMSSGSVDTDNFNVGNSQSQSNNNINSKTGWSSNDELRLRRALESVVKERVRVRQAILGCYSTSSQTSLQSHHKSTAEMQPKSRLLISQCDLSSFSLSSSSNHNNNHNNSSSSNSNNNCNIHSQQHHQYPHPAQPQQFSVDNSILIQEVCMLKEERATLKTRIYLLEKDIYSLQLSLDGRLSIEKVLQMELSQYQHQSTNDNNNNNQNSHNDNNDQVASLLRTTDELRDKFTEYQNNSDALMNDLKRANGALISAFERSRKKYQTRISRMETRIGVAHTNSDSIIIPPSEQTAL